MCPIAGWLTHLRWLPIRECCLLRARRIDGSERACDCKGVPERALKNAPVAAPKASAIGTSVLVLSGVHAPFTGARRRADPLTRLFADEQCERAGCVCEDISYWQ